MAKIDLDLSERAVLVQACHAMEESYTRDLNAVLQNPLISNAVKTMMQESMGPMISRVEAARSRLEGIKER